MDAVGSCPTGVVPCLFEGYAPIFELPNEIFFRIFRSLDTETLLCARKVCRRFHATIQNDLLLQAKVIHKAVFKGVLRKISRYTRADTHKDLYEAAANMLVLTHQREAAPLFVRTYRLDFQEAVALALVKEFPEEALNYAEEREKTSPAYKLLSLLEGQRFPKNHSSCTVINKIIDEHFKNKQLMDRINLNHYENVPPYSPLSILWKLQIDPECFHVESFRRDIESHMRLRIQDEANLRRTVIRFFLHHARSFHKMGRTLEANSFVQEAYSMLKLDFSNELSFQGLFIVWAPMNYLAALNAFKECYNEIKNPILLHNLLILFAYYGIKADPRHFFGLIDLIENERPDLKTLTFAEPMVVPLLLHLIILDEERGKGLLRLLYGNSPDTRVLCCLIGTLVRENTHIAKNLCEVFPEYRFSLLCQLAFDTSDRTIRKDVLSIIQKELDTFIEIDQDDELLMKQVKGYSFFDLKKAEECAERVQNTEKKEAAYKIIFNFYIAASKVAEGFQFLKRLDLDDELRTKIEDSGLQLFVDRDLFKAIERAKVSAPLQERYLITLSKKVCSILSNKGMMKVTN